MLVYCGSGTGSLDEEGIGYMGVCCRLAQKSKTLLLKAGAEELVGFPQAGWVSGGDAQGMAVANSSSARRRATSDLSYQKTTRQTGRDTPAQGN